MVYVKGDIIKITDKVFGFTDKKVFLFCLKQ